MNTGDYFAYPDGEQRFMDFAMNNTGYIIDTHYAGHTQGTFKNAYRRGLSEDNLELLAIEKELMFVLVDLDANTLQERRRTNKKTKHNLDINHIICELDMNRKYFQDYCSQTNYPAQIIFNNRLKDSLAKLEKIARKVK